MTTNKLHIIHSSFPKPYLNRIFFCYIFLLLNSCSHFPSSSTKSQFSPELETPPSRDSIDLRIPMNSTHFRHVMQWADSTNNFYTLAEIFLLPAREQFPANHPSQLIYEHYRDSQKVLFDILALQNYIDRKGVAQFLWAESEDQIMKTIVALRFIRMNELALGLEEITIQWNINSAAYQYWIQTREFREISKRMGIDWFEELYMAQSRKLLLHAIKYVENHRNEFITST